MKILVVNRNLIVSIFAVTLFLYSVQGISYGQGKAPSVTPGETNTSLKVSFADFLFNYDEKAYQIQLRRKDPQGEWITKCSSIKIGGGSSWFFGLFHSSSSGNYIISAIFTDLEPGVTYEARYRDTNVSECIKNPPNPDPWSAIGEGTTHLVAPPRVEFADVPLAWAVRRALRLDTRGAHIELLKIPEVNLDRLTQLQYDNDSDTKEQLKISNLSGLEHATQLTTLSLQENNLRDLTPLAQLTQLTELDLSNNNISDITPLAQLTQLTKLSLAGFPSGNEVSDLTPLAQLTQLTALDLSHNKNIRDLSPLSGLTHLTELNLRDNNISDLTPLAQLIQLIELDLWGNEISDLTPLAQLTQLTELELTGNNINDITPLAQLTQLTELAIGFNNISDITPLAQLTQLTTIWYRNYSDPFPASEIELLTVSTPQPLTSKSLNGSSVTLTLLPSGAVYDTSIDNIRSALTVSGISGVTVSEIIRMSDTELKVTFGFTGDLAEIAELTISLEQGAVSGYQGRSLTGAIHAYPELGLTLTSSQPLTVLSLDGSVVTLTLNGSTWRGYPGVNAIAISGISGISLGRRAINRVSPTVLTIELTFHGNIETDTILTFAISASAIEDYDGPPLTAEIPVSASTDGLTFTASTAYPLSAITLNGSVVTLKLSGGTFVSSDNVEDALTISGITGITFEGYDSFWHRWEKNEVNWISGTKITFRLAYSGTVNADTKLIISLGPEAISGYNGPPLTAEIPVSASTEVEVTGELVASTAFPLTKATLNGSIVKLTLKNHEFTSSISDFYLTTSTPGANISHRRHSGGGILVRISFTGNLDADAKLTIIVLPRNIADYNGPPLAAELPVTVKTGQQVLVPNSERPPMYWINTDTDKIESVEPFDAVAQQVASLTVDTVGSKIYWSEHGSSSGTIKRANLDGTNVEVLVTRPTTPQSITVDTVGKKLYWINSLEGKIQSADLNGENISTVIQLDDSITHIAVDAEGSKLYWADSQFRIRRVNFDGTGIETPLTGWNSYRTRRIGGIAIADGKIYWTERQIWSEYGGIIHRANLNGTNLETFVTSLGEPIGLAVDTVGGKVYWTNSYGGIQRMDINGGEIENVVYGIAAPGDLALGAAVTSTTPTTSETPATTDAVVSISPASVASPAVGEQLEFSLKIAGGEAVAGYQATVQFDTTALRYISGVNGDYLPAGAFFVEPKVEGNLVKLNAVSLAGESSGDGTLATLTFEVIAPKASTLTLSDVLLSNSAGTKSLPQVENGQVTAPSLNADVNGDGSVDLQDLAIVNARLGQTGENSADINGDGVVDVADLALVAGAIENGAAAPSLQPQVLTLFTAADVKLWLSQAQRLDLTDTVSQRGILFLEQLLAVLTPKETALLANYPNPFNPETWIPYHLAKDAKVTLHIYAVNGTLVRTLTLGYQSAGMYQSRSRAAYWDGKNEFGESVASGLYFYTLSTESTRDSVTAGDFSATRKMLIRK